LAWRHSRPSRRPGKRDVAPDPGPAAGAGARATGLFSSAAGAEVLAALAAETGSRVAAAEDAVNGYNAHQVAAAVARVPSLRIEIVKRSDNLKGFVVLPHRWVVERTFSWFERNRRLAKDWENLATTLQPSSSWRRSSSQSADSRDSCLLSQALRRLVPLRSQKVATHTKRLLRGRRPARGRGRSPPIIRAARAGSGPTMH
jgi:transposase